MCGLTGCWYLQAQPQEISLAALGQAMAARLVHRGPDSAGVWVDQEAKLVLAHQRLSIVDLSSAGHQPMISPSGNWIIVYNGEIYNTVELRAELMAAGISFQGSSDTEVILKACELWGVEQAVKKFIGMFAFAIWEKNQRRLYLVRDRLGIKPLYWGFHRGILFFGSELKSFVVHPQWRAEIDRDALVAYFRFGYIPAPYSIYQHIFKLEPGHMVIVDEQSNVKNINYWHLMDVIDRGKQQPLLNETDAITQLETLLRDAIKRRMVADVPLGAFLSGGIDSSLVVALMQAQSDKPIKTFTIGFEQADYNEAEYGRAVATHLGTEHHELLVRAHDAQAVIPQLATWYDEPFADSSQIPTYLVAKLARQMVTVSLSGDGGDEIFAGYSRYLVANSFWSLFGFMPLALRKLLAKCLNSLRPDQWNYLAKFVPASIRPSNITEKIDKFATLLASTQDNFYQSLMSLWSDPELLVNGGKATAHWDLSHKSLNCIERMQSIDAMTYLPDDILTKVDRASMAVSLEARVPLIDHRVVEFAWQLPMKMKANGNHGKWILRQILNRYVPASLYERPKMGFGVPLDHWLRGPLRSWAEDLLSIDKLQAQGILNAKLIQQRWQAHLSGQRNFRYSLWSVLMFQAWYQQWVA
jgi:asparagine synthase (glutamine-hydrolysing)